MIQAVREQAAGISAILRPLLGEGDANANDSDVPSPLLYIHYLYRDWAWPSDPDGENERALRTAQSVMDGKPVGRLLVLGAGACRLAYDLHCADPTAETTVVDIDPLLFAAAHTVIRGGSVTIREANAEVDELGHVDKEWTLRAPQGALDDDRFHFRIADGLDAPFAAHTFDTVLTPWFIDLVPTDLRDFIGEVFRLLKPGGRWINLGPLRYRPEIPVIHRFSREEVFELARRAGFRIDRWIVESVPYLVSKLNGRGKVESVLAFSANPVSGTTDTELPPAWLLFRHLPIPVFPGLSMFVSDDPAEQMVASAIDGRHTLDDIAAIIASKAGDTGLTMTQFRKIVRRCLMDIHPGCL